MTQFTVFGSSGFIGGYVADYLRQRGHAVHTPSRANLFEVTGNLGHVIYAIGLTANFREKPFETMDANIGVLSGILKKQNFETFTYISSTRVYSGSEETNEETALNFCVRDPDSLYDLSKATGEALVLNQSANNRVIRLSNVVGPVREMASSFIKSLYDEALEGEIKLRSHLMSVKDYIWIGDVTKMIEIIALKGTHSIYNVASGVQIKHGFWVDKIQSKTGCKLDCDDAAPLHSFAPISVDKITNEFGFSPLLADEFWQKALDHKDHP